MSKKIIFIGLTALFIFSGLLFAKQPGSGMQMHYLERNLELTEEQKSKMLDLHLQLRKEMLPLKSEQEKLQADLKMEMTADKFNQGKTRKIVEQMSDLRTTIQMKRIMNQREVRNLLTEEQRKKFDMHILSKEPGSGRHGKGLPHRPMRPMFPEEMQEDR